MRENVTMKQLAEANGYKFKVTVRHNGKLVLRCFASDEEYARNKAAIIQNLGSNAYGDCDMAIVNPYGVTVYTARVVV